MSTTESTQTWKPGDVANNHVLAEDGTWLPLAAPAQPQWRPEVRPEPWHRNVGLRIGAGIIGVFLLVGGVGVAASNSEGSTGSTTSTSTSTTSSSDSDLSPDSKQLIAESAWGQLDQSQRDSICGLYNTSPTLAESMASESIDDASMIPYVMTILAADC